MSQDKILSSPVSRPARIILTAVYFFYITVILRTLAEAEALATWLPVYLTLEFIFGVLFTLVLWRPIRTGAWQHIYFSFQSLIGVFLVALHPDLDFTNVLLVMLSFQAALLLTGRVRWVWVTLLLLLIILSLTVLLGVYGLALALLPTTVAIVFAAYVAITQEIDAEQHKQQALLNELQEANRQLTAYAGQVEELATLQERNRLSREMHDTVSQNIFSISLLSRATRILLERNPERLQPQLERLQELTKNTLEEMRSQIADLRPRENRTSGRPTP